MDRWDQSNSLAVTGLTNDSTSLYNLIIEIGKDGEQGVMFNNY